jgi:hypothetical protein
MCLLGFYSDYSYKKIDVDRAFPIYDGGLFAIY